MIELPKIFLKRERLKSGSWLFTARPGPFSPLRLRFNILESAGGQRNTPWRIISVEGVCRDCRVRKLSSAESAVRAVAEAWWYAKAVADARIHDLQQDD